MGANVELMELVNNVSNMIEAMDEFIDKSRNNSDVFNDEVLLALINTSDKQILSRYEFNKFYENVCYMNTVLHGTDPWLDNSDIQRLCNIINELTGKYGFIEVLNRGERYMIHLITQETRDIFNNLLEIYYMIYPEVNCYNMRIIEDQFSTIFNCFIDPMEKLTISDMNYCKINSLLSWMELPYIIESVGSSVNERYIINKFEEKQ